MTRNLLDPAAQLGRTGERLVRARLQQLTTVAHAVGRADLPNGLWLDSLRLAAVKDARSWELQGVLRIAWDLAATDTAWRRWLDEYRDTLHLTVYCGLRARGAVDEVAAHAADAAAVLVTSLHVDEVAAGVHVARLDAVLEKARQGWGQNTPGQPDAAR
jgi:hypothetical protein